MAVQGRYEVLAVTFEENGWVSIQYIDAQDSSPRRPRMKRDSIDAEQHPEQVAELAELLGDLIQAGNDDHRDPPARVPIT